MVGIINPVTSFFHRIGINLSPLNKDEFPVVPAGTSGTEIYAGRYNEEYLQGLIGEDAVVQFDKMRRSDAQVKMLLSVVKNPIKSANWNIEAAGEEERDVEIAEFVKHALFNDLKTSNGQKRKNFTELLGEILTCIEFGYSIFERVHKVVRNHPRFGDYTGLADIGFRHPRSIEEWILNNDGSINHVRQLVDGDLSKYAMINGEHLLVFTIDKEGDNYEGISMLRPCYGAWYRKNNYRKFQAIGIERSSLGAFHGEIDASIVNRSDYDSQRKAFEDVLNKISTHEKNSIVSPAGMKVNEVKLSHDSEKVQKVINSENVEMSKAFLVTFMEMGIESNGGSYSLGSDLSDIFLSGIEFLGDYICEKINDEIIEPLVRAKYGELEVYPKLKHKGINDKAGKEFAEVMKILGDSAMIQVSDRVKAYLHDRYDLPEFDPELEMEEESDNDDPDDDLPEDPEPEPEPDAQLSCKSSPHFDHAYKEVSEPLISQYGSGQLSRFEDITLDEMIYKAASEDIRLADVAPSVYIARQAEKLETILRESIIERSDKMIDTMITIYKRDGSRARALEQTMPHPKKLKDSLKSFTGEVGQTALEKVLKELGKSRSDTKFSEEDFKNLPRDSKQKLLQEILLLAGFLDKDVEKAILFSFNDSFDKTDSPAALNQELKRKRDRFLAGATVRAAATNMSSKVVNSVRNDVFKEPEINSDIESFVFRNPSPKSAICQNLNGRVFSKEEYEVSDNLPPLHHNCKSYIAAQTVGKKGNKDIDPKGLRIVGNEDEIEKALKSKSL